MKQIFIWFSPKCTLKCSHCSIGSTDTPNDILSVTQRKQMIDKLAKWPGTNSTINFLGGELFFNTTILELVSYSSQLGFKTTITTNAITITTDLVDKICESGLSHLTFSLDSANPKIHDYLRGKDGCYNHALKIINLFLQNGSRPKLYINTLIQKENSNDLNKIVELCISKKLDGISFQPIAPPAIFAPPKGQSIINMIKSKFNIPFSWGKYRYLFPLSSKIIPELEKLIQLKKNGAPIINTSQDMKDFIIYFSKPKQYLKKKICTACDSVSIMPDGKLKLCPSGKSLGNIFNDNIQECYSSSLSTKQQNKIKNCNHPCLVLSLFKDDYYF